MPSLNLENSIVDEQYEVRRRLSHGSYAEIYEAFDLKRSRRPVIIKALNTHLQGTPDPELERTLVENFQNEAVALDELRHPNVVQRLGHGTAADLMGVPFHYLVLEYMSGGDLLTRCRKKPLSLEETIYYFRQVCDALDEAHARNIVHRDIKPNNLLFSSNGVVIKLIDFGVAKMRAGVDEEVTRVGTDIYAPPEHNPNEGDSKGFGPVTAASDVYSLAKAIYTAMTGSGPREFARRPIESLPPQLASKPWGPRLLEILRKATASRPSERYQSVQRFWEDFTTLSSHLAAPGANGDEEGDDATEVRPRTATSEAALPAPAPVPDFRPTLADSVARPGGPRIVVELPEAPDVATAPRRQSTEVKVPPAPPVVRPKPEAPAKSKAKKDSYSYREDLRDLVGSGWRLWLTVMLVVMTLLASVAGVFLEVYRYVRHQNLPRGRVVRQSLNLQDQPGTNATVIGHLPRETRVLVVGRDDSQQWIEIEVVEWGGASATEQPEEGWVSARGVQIEQAGGGQ
jgi:eukaryotic-like serine/threonine-protein kinase